MRATMRALFCAAAMGLSVCAAPARAAWTEPKDGAFTEKELTSYIEVMKEWTATNKAAEKAIQGQSGMTALGVLARTNQKFQASITAHGLTQPEFEFVGGKVWECWGAALRDGIVEKVHEDAAKQVKDNQDRMAADKRKLAEYQAAQKAGRKVLTKEEREQVVASAKEDQKSALEEAKQHADEAKAAAQKATEAEAEAKAAEQAMKKPPKDLNEDDRNACVEEKKNAAESARNNAKESRDAEAEAKKAEAESRAKAATAASRMKDPDLPLSDEDKAQAKQANEQQIAALQENIKNTEEGNKLAQEGAEQMAKQMKSDDKVNPQNVAIFKKHQKEFEVAFGMDKK